MAWSSEAGDVLGANQEHCINTASRRRAVATLRQFRGRRFRVLDVGCFDGNVLAEIRRHYPCCSAVGIDRYPTGRGTIQSDALSLPFADATFDAVVSLNVLEHIRDDRAAVAEIRRVLRPGGIVHLEVPANPALFDAHDRFLGHERRYRMCDLLEILGHAGLRVVRKTHLGALLYPGFWAVKRLNAFRSAEDRPVVERDVRRSNSALVRSLLQVEDAIQIALPFGIRCIVVARR